MGASSGTRRALLVLLAAGSLVVLAGAVISPMAGGCGQRIPPDVRGRAAAYQGSMMLLGQFSAPPLMESAAVAAAR